MNRAELDVIIPCRNEAENIEKIASELTSTLSSVGISYTLIFVDDNSTDGTSLEVARVAEKYATVSQIKSDKDSNEIIIASPKIKLVKKAGPAGKATAVLQGIRAGAAPFIAMIDGDLQYPPSEIPKMYAKAQKSGMVVANRKKQKVNILRKIGTKIDQLIFEKLLLGLSCDSQSGLKIFKREIADNLDTKKVTPWTLDVPLILTAIDMGFKVENHDIEFSQRTNGRSKVNFLKAGIEIAKSNIKLAFRKKKIYPIYAESKKTAVGAGVAYGSKRFITHTRLSHKVTALKTFVPWQRNLFLTLITLFIAGVIVSPILALKAVICVLTIFYFLDLVFSVFIVNRSLNRAREIRVSKREIAKLKDKDLPVYSIFCPLYKEALVLPQFINSIEKLNWPKDKLDVLLLLEEDDKETIAKANELTLPEWISVKIVPNSLPKTKPKACNYGLNFAKGEYAVIYDAEDKPDPDQLKKAFIGFQKSSRKVVCLQCKLNYYNSTQNVLTRLFTAEYSLWYDLILPGLQTLNTTIPLGGTSNHFRTSALRYLDGWDPFNVTEDADLGTRLFKENFRTSVVDSTTLEEANSKYKGWIKQRSRWIKGYMQTYLVHMRNPLAFYKKYGRHMFIFQLITGLRMVFTLVNPILWLVTISYFAFRPYIGTYIEALYPSFVFYFAAGTMVAGNFFYFYLYMVALAKKGKWDLIKYTFYIPMYWLMTSIAATISFYQLLTNPHYWDKTMHGLHLKPAKKAKVEVVEGKLPEPEPALSPLPRPRISVSPAISGSFALILATVFSLFANFLFSAYLGRVMDVSEFGNLTLVNNIYSFASVITTAIAATMTYKSAFTLGRFGTVNKRFWRKTRKSVYNLSLLATLFWIAGSSWLSVFFNIDHLSLLLFSPFWVITFVSAVDTGFLRGVLKFGVLSLTFILQPATKLALAYLFVHANLTEGVYLSIPLSAILPFLICWFYASREKSTKKFLAKSRENVFPYSYFGASALYKISSVFYLNLDVLLAKHYLSAGAAGEFALLSLAAKIIYFIGTLFSQFVVPVVSHAEGAGKGSREAFKLLFAATSASSLLGYILIGQYGRFLVPVLFGEKAVSIVGLMPIYSFGVLCFTLASAIISYHQAKGRLAFPILAFLISVMQISYTAVFHENISQFALVTALVGAFYLIYVTALHTEYDYFASLVKSFANSITQIAKYKPQEPSYGKLRVVIFNWRDTKHKWAGGAEVYVHELAKRMVSEGHVVTVFCANDGNANRSEIIDGVKIVRFGNFFSVYVWAFIFYMFRFRGKVDVIIDSENGIPFFTPLYASETVIGLIHHVHRDIILKNLKLPFYLLPFALVAKKLEEVFMPIAYKDAQMIAVSASTLKQMELIGFNTDSEVKIVTPGVDTNEITPGAKTAYPSILYLGRLQAYKSVDTVIFAMAEIVKQHPSAVLNIAGFGPSGENLQKLARKLGIAKNVNFLGKVNEEEKKKLLKSSWVFAYPSSMEGFGISVVEAAAAGTPVVASNVPGLRDSVSPAVSGFLVEYGNAHEFAEKINLLISNDDLRERMSAQSRAWSENFTWDKSAQTLVSVITSAIRTKEAIFVPRISPLAKSN